jgi:hypothetical protein
MQTSVRTATTRGHMRARAREQEPTIAKKSAQRPTNAAGTPPRGEEERPGRAARPAKAPAPEGSPGFFARHGRALAWGLAASYAILFSAVSIRKYRLYLYNDFDFAIFVQATSRILHGSFYSSIAGMNLLGAHSVLILPLLAPIFAVFHHPVTLLVVQSVGLGLGAIPVYRMAQRQFGAGFTAVSCAVLYLAFPALGHVNLLAGAMWYTRAMRYTFTSTRAKIS